VPHDATTEAPNAPTHLNARANSIGVRGVRHVYPDGHEALSPTDLEVTAGQFFTLLGPSGSGKTTLLRVFAGLLRPTEGRVYIGERDVTDTAVQDRNVGFVFQHYALFPHLSVADNLAFPLKVRGVSARARGARVDDLLDLVNLGGQGHKMPGALSGGQQQRVAVARALVYDPDVLLLDEPLGALDRRLRQRLGADLRRIQRETGTTAVYVTHDQEEAFLLSDTVVVMDHGRVLQSGDPEEVYRRPRSPFVASFLGDTNVIAGVGEMGPDGHPNVSFGSLKVRLADPVSPAVGEVRLSVRPEDIALHVESEPVLAPGHLNIGQFAIESVTFMGGRYRVQIQNGNLGKLTVDAHGGEALGEALQSVDTVTASWNKTAPVVLQGP
jgi:putative spermidine/putrescine transport system ATP-binding protein